MACPFQDRAGADRCRCWYVRRRQVHNCATTRAPV
jgi:hypothetical protein